ncbi:hypothetical protein LYY12_004533 [Salmonella enterica]|nr:hypothetical protein [Salmonella enterica]EIR9666632.1 hypothetical protein [Salmonella enterica]
MKNIFMVMDSRAQFDIDSAASRNDMANGARHNPPLLEQYAHLEAKTGYTMHMSRIPIRTLAADGEKQEQAA